MQKSILIALGFSITLLFVQRRRRRASSRKVLPLPPGPPALPIIGNALDMPSSYQWLTFAKWAKEYGDIVHIQLFGQHIVILDSVTAVDDLLEKRSSIYSNKPRMLLINDLMGWSWSFSFMRYGQRWRRYRRLFHQHFYAKGIKKYEDAVTEEARKTLLRLIRSPKDFMELIHLTFAATTVRVVYGIEIDNSDDHYYKIARSIVHGVAETGDAIMFLLDALPILKYMPSWLPGAGWKKKAQLCYEQMPTFLNWPFEVTKAAFHEGKARLSVVAECLNLQRTNAAVDDETIKHVSALAYAGGSDTSVSTLQTFFLAMLLHPDIQRKAQKQVDEVVGKDRLPEFKDLDSLPYVRAIFKELLRWQPVLPIAGPHMVSTDDVYRGYRIPKGTLVIGNSWSILHDETTYKDPMAFKPDRFLKTDGTLDPHVQDSKVAAFGFGRRICPGRHFAESSALITIASILATLDITPSERDSKYPLSPNDATRETEFSDEIMTSGLISYPQPFSCTIHPRTSGVAAMIEHALQSDKMKLLVA